MIYAMTIIMVVAEVTAICLIAFLALRYSSNIASIRRPGPKRTWCRIFTLFLTCAFLCQCLTWCQGYIKCLDTSHTMLDLLHNNPKEVHDLCKIWSPLSHTARQALFVAYLTFMSIAVCSFQFLVLERYRKVSSLFPNWASQYALPIYAAAYIPIGLVAYVTSVLEFFLSPSTLISRDATINTISSAVYCIWIVTTGVSDAVLSLLIVTTLRRNRVDMQTLPSQRRRGSHISLTSPADCTLRQLRMLQIFFSLIVVFDFCILSLTAVKKMDGHGIHGHVFAYEVASIEIACTLVHTTLTLMFMQMLGVVLRPIQPQFEFVINPESSSLSTHQIPFFIEPATKVPAGTSGFESDISWKSAISSVHISSDFGHQKHEPVVQMKEIELQLSHDGMSHFDHHKHESVIQTTELSIQPSHDSSALEVEEPEIVVMLEEFPRNHPVYH